MSLCPGMSRPCMLVICYQETGSLCPFAFLFQEALVILTTRRRVKCILAGISFVYMVFLKTGYHDDPLTEVILGKIILKQRMPQVKSDCYYWACCFQGVDSAFVFLLKRPACSWFRERHLTREKLEPRRKNHQQWSLKHATTYFSTNMLLLCLGNLPLCLVSILG